MDFSQKDFQILDALDSDEITTQRQLAEQTGISLGQVNYVLKSLLEKGLIKIGNFRKNKNKIGYAYLLTPKGLEAKSHLAVDFVTTKLKEYQSLRCKLRERLALIQGKGHKKFIFIGPEIVKEVIASIIKENDLGLSMIDHFDCLTDLGVETSKTKSYDILLLFEGSAKSVDRAKKMSGLSAQCILPLW